MSQSRINYIPWLGIPHNYSSNNCISLIAQFYEKELKIPFEEERVVFNNFSIIDIKDLRRIPLSRIYDLKNWQKIDLTELQEFDILVYTRNQKLSHFSMYVGQFKILDLREGCTSQLRHFNDISRNNIESAFRHKQLVT